MSFCCGASMIGALGSLRHYRTYINNVPILHCPVCNRIDVHPKVEEEYEIICEYAQTDDIPEIDFKEYISKESLQNIFENCTVVDEGSIEQVFRQQIDSALDLLIVAKQIKDREWEEMLKKRLNRLSERLSRWQTREKQR
ncbi:hypothetical protein BEP19_14030 [Ammoniphilus oxalaticus]|uniref:YgiT-type zinc finger domain-containing protein n=1 Tax=Ammoniphilus oxalaticus TaxID=66863 RepID=A0A419SF32_9BACL|nr:hypothetical protein [Ammoniphilus oxalaticus]RKD21740.1 hypothetical protein BEP19_14030 [Ammoniphilus oxalaticus]